MIKNCITKIITILRSIIPIVILFSACIGIHFLTTIISFLFNVNFDTALNLTIGTAFIMIGILYFSLFKAIPKAPEISKISKIFLIILFYLGPLSEVIIGISLIITFISSLN